MTRIPGCRKEEEEEEEEEEEVKVIDKLHVHLYNDMYTNILK